MDRPPNRLDIEHVLEGERRTVSSSDGWTLMNSKYYTDLICFVERCATETRGLKWRYKTEGEPTLGLIEETAKKLLGQL